MLTLSLIFLSKTKQAIVKSRIDEDSEDHIYDSNSDCIDNQVVALLLRDNQVVALLLRLPTPHESHLLVFTLLYNFFPLDLGWFYDSFVSENGIHVMLYILNS